VELYSLDSLFRRQEIINQYESLVWAERMRAFGDFKLKVHPTAANKARFVEGLRLASDFSKRVMTIETVEDAEDESGKRFLMIQGRSIEALLMDRLARPNLDDLTETPKWILTGTPGEIVRQIFHDICVTGLLDTADIIPFVIEGSISPADTLPEPTDEITVELEPMSVYDAIADICTKYDMGFRLLRDGDTSQLYWDVYMGSNRTSSQTDLEAVIFSPDLDNLHSTRELSTIAIYKNVCYVLSPVGVEIVYALDVDPSTEGFERKVMWVKADDITDPLTAVAQMQQMGKEALSQHRQLRAFDGEIDPQSRYKYQEHFWIGDLVEQRSETGAANNMQVTEQIFISDQEGERSFPTLTLNKFITPGSWEDWRYNVDWDDMDDTEFWDTQPD
jgi:hypothetical protein